jgi:predicted O-linked N-acetylglucosamine transferase (SPINDLY family)
MNPPAIEDAIKLHKAGQLAEAEAAYWAFLERNPSDKAALYGLAVTVRKTGRPQQAVELLKRLLQSAPQFEDGYNDLIIVLRELGRFDEAIAVAQQAVLVAPASPKAHINLGIVLGDVLRFSDAIACYREGIRLAPHLAEGHCNLGLALLKLTRLDEAAEALREAARRDPTAVQVHMNLGHTLLGLGEVEGACATYRKGMEADPRHANVHANLLLAMHYLPEIDAQKTGKEHRKWAERHAESLRDEWMPFINDRNPERPLRIGYVSSDFRRHSVWYFFIPLLERRNRRMFTTFCYFNFPMSDDLTERVRTSCDGWREVVGMRDEELARLIRFDEIDILLDLSGHTSGNRLRTFARKPSPIQVTYLGYPNTTGMTAMDYRLTDGLVDPPGKTELLHTEKLWRLPTCAWCYQPVERAPEIKPRSDGPIVFGCFNAQMKMNRKDIAAWAEILRRVPDSRLLLKSAGAGQASARRKIFAQLEAEGISPEKVETVGMVAEPIEHLRTYHRVDIALDTFPYGGTTTTCEAMWMGVPVVTLAGETHVSRVGVSLLTNVGLSELVARDAEEYVAIAVGLANDGERLAKLRSELRGRMTLSSLMDGKRFTGEFEDACRLMWRRWCAEQRPGTASATEQLREGVADQQAGRLLDAEREYRRVLSADRNNAGALHLLGTIAGGVGLEQEAVRLIRRAIDVWPDHVEARRDLGALLAKQGRYDEAIAEHLEAARIRPDYFDAHLALGDMFHQLGRNEEAVQSYSRAAAIKRDSTEAYCGLGESLLALGRANEAVAEFSRAAQVSPGVAAAQFGLANSLRASGRQAEALKAYVAAITAKPDFALGYYTLGQTLEEVGRLDNAAGAYQRAAEIDPGYVAAWQALGQLLQRQGNGEQARECFARAMAISQGGSGRLKS